MTPARLKAIRHALGLSAQGFADAARVSNGATVRKWERGANDIPGPVTVLAELWSDPRLPADLKPKPYDGRKPPETGGVQKSQANRG